MRGTIALADMWPAGHGVRLARRPTCAPAHANAGDQAPADFGYAILLGGAPGTGN